MSFNEFWELYPRKVSKRAAVKAWEKEMKAGTSPEIIVEGLRKQLQMLTMRDTQFIPHPASWINGGRWEDELQPIKVRPQVTRPSSGMAGFLASRQEMQDAFTLDAQFTRTTDRDASPVALEGIAYRRGH